MESVIQYCKTEFEFLEEGEIVSTIDEKSIIREDKEQIDLLKLF